MIWEISVIGVLLVLVLIHLYFNKVYSDRIRQLDADMAEMGDSDIDEDYVGEAIIDRARMSAQANVDRVNNLYHAVFVHGVCIAGLIVMLVLNQAGLAIEMGWMSATILPLPVCIFVYHLRNALALPVRRRGRSLSNVP